MFAGFASCIPCARSFAAEFSDVYEIGIKETVQKLNLRCERVDEIEFNDSILSQIYKGIQSADLLIADVTGRNPNVFYEIGYAHALAKQVVLIAKDVADIPFDLKGHNHIIYGGQLRTLKSKLEARLRSWLENVPQ